MFFATGGVTDNNSVGLVEGVLGEQVVLHGSNDSVVELSSSRLVLGAVEVDDACRNGQANHNRVGGGVQFKIVCVAGSGWREIQDRGVGCIEVGGVEIRNGSRVKPLHKGGSD